MSHNSFAELGEDWTEEEIMSYGLAGEDEYIEIGGDVNINVEESVELSSPRNVSYVQDVTKSGRARKKTAKLIEMEEQEKLDKKALKIMGTKKYELKSAKGYRGGACQQSDSLQDREMKPQVTSRSPKGKVRSGCEVTPDSHHDASFTYMTNYHPNKTLSPGCSDSESLPFTADLASVSEEYGHQFPSSLLGEVKMSSKRDLNSEQVSGTHSLEIDGRLKKKEMKQKLMDEKRMAKQLLRLQKLKEKPKKQRPKGYSAYMLWCSMQRAKVIALNPGIDFSTISKRLGDIWQTVPEKEKVNWRRKARMMNKKSSSQNAAGKPKSGGGLVGRPPSIKFGDSRLHQKVLKYKKKDIADSHLHSNYKVSGTTHIDIAAHLKLLGESLAVIGARLQEHKGQIAVQGSLSVLLDSLLCSLGPLMCLTNQVPELNGCSEEMHASTLDNIAYIMPGVG